MINDYRRSDFKKKSDEDGNVRYMFKCNGQFIEVNKEVYSVCIRSYYNMEKADIRDVKRAVTTYADLDKTTSFFVGFNKNVDWLGTIYINDIYDYIAKEISMLRKSTDRLVAECIFLEGMSIGETAKLLGIAKSTVHKKKKRIQKYLQVVVANKFF